MTENEAKTKWCFKANADAVPSERLPPGERDITKAHARCIGSACMAWRWSGVWDGNYGFTNDSQDVRDRLAAGKLMEHEKSVGFCGLAGKP